MKSVVLFFSIWFAIFSWSCNKDNYQQEVKIVKSDLSGQKEINPDNGSAKENASLQTITSIEVKQHIGDSLIIKGNVADVYLSDKVAYLNFENKFPKNVFSCAIFSGKFSEFGDLSKFKGKKVEIKGRISTYKNKPQVILNSKDQIKIIQ